MPFWWRRRRKPWFGRWRRKPRRTYRKRRKTYKTRYYRRRPRTRRRRRRRRKVRRKKQTITVKQWQPDSITKCRIKGLGVMVLGADGRQMYCYTDEKTTTVPPKTPCGGGFGVEVFSLKYLYEEYKFHNNIWTKTNIYKDLCRYLWCKFTFYRHDTVDFVISYDRQPPFNLDKLTYCSTHPHQLLQHKHKKILLSTKTNPNGKLTKKFFVKPPKQMISKWFFTSDFCPYTLVQFRAAAMDLKFSYLGCCNENQQLGLYYLNQEWFKDASWGHAQGTPYKPTANLLTTYWRQAPPPKKQIHIKAGHATGDTYDTSISYDNGWFQKDLLIATKLGTKETGADIGMVPINTTIYNPNLDDGEGNVVYLTSILTKTYDTPSKDHTTTITNLPLWLAIFGLYDYIAESKKTREFWDLHVVICRSKALLPLPQPGFQGGCIFIDKSFIEGYAPFHQPPTSTQRTKWYPTMRMQVNSLNSIVECGPLIPKFRDGATISTWELKYNYTFSFKWGGPLITDAEVQDPCKQPRYDVPDKLFGQIQIQNPEKITSETLLHPWDFRRGFIKEAALKRVSDNISIDTAFQESYLAEPPKKKKRMLPQLTSQNQEKEEILQCLRDLYKESTSQDQETEDLKQLIQQQQQQQHELKRNLLHILADMKMRQHMLQLQTGIIN
nr:MAG: ORF1 [Torque teno midi virus]